VCFSAELLADFMDEWELCDDFGELEEEDELVDQRDKTNVSSYGGRI